jgi:alanine dehydrogenase
MDESWRNRKTLILSRTDIMGLVTPAEYVACVEQAYRMHGEGRFYMDPKGHIVLDKYPGEWEAMPSYIEEPEAAACKWVSIREQNRERFGLPTVFSILIYTHPETGFPLAIVDGSYHTVMRTGAAAAVSAKWLAREDSKVLAIVGAGHMAEGRSRPATPSSTGTRCGSGAAQPRRSTTSPSAMTAASRSGFGPRPTSPRS